MLKKNIFFEKMMKKFVFLKIYDLFCIYKIKNNHRELPEWLKEQFAKLSSSNRCMSSNLILSTKKPTLAKG